MLMILAISIVFFILVAMWCNTWPDNKVSDVCFAVCLSLALAGIILFWQTALTTLVSSPIPQEELSPVETVVVMYNSDGEPITEYVGYFDVIHNGNKITLVYEDGARTTVLYPADTTLIETSRKGGISEHE